MYRQVSLLVDACDYTRTVHLRLDSRTPASAAAACSVAYHCMHETLLLAQHKLVSVRRRDRKLCCWSASARVRPLTYVAFSRTYTRTHIRYMLLCSSTSGTHSHFSFVPFVVWLNCVGVIIIWVSFGIQFAIFRDEDRFGICVVAERLCHNSVWFCLILNTRASEKFCCTLCEEKYAQYFVRQFALSQLGFCIRRKQCMCTFNFWIFVVRWNWGSLDRWK